MSRGAAQNGRQAAGARERILDAADALFGELGFDAASTREIAERSGVNKALIHYHFENKDGLLVQVLDRYYDALATTLLEALAAGADLRDKLLRLVDGYVDFLAANRGFLRIVQREASGGRHMDLVHARTEPLFATGIELLQQAFPATRGGAMDAAQLLTSVYGMIITYFTYDGVLGRLLGADPLAPAGLAARKRHLHHLIEVLLADIAPPAAVVEEES